MGDQ